MYVCGTSLLIVCHESTVDQDGVLGMDLHRCLLECMACTKDSGAADRPACTQLRTVTQQRSRLRTLESDVTECCLAPYKFKLQLDKKLGDQIILADFGGFLAIGAFFVRQYHLSNCRKCERLC